MSQKNKKNKKKQKKKPKEEMTDHIPVIDLAGLFGSDEEQKRVGRVLIETYSTIGFSYVTNHNIPSDLLARLMKQNAAFHSLPNEKKLESRLNKHHRGFIEKNTLKFATNNLEKVSSFSENESIIFQKETERQENNPLAGPNQWPNVINFKETALEYMAAMESLSRLVLKAIALALEGPVDFFEKHLDSPVTFLRFVKYPPQTGTNTDGSSPHTDYGCITFVLQDQIGGLEVKTPEGEWVRVTPKAGTLILNTGDLLSKWTNGILMPTPHCVRLDKENERYSVVYFFDPSYDTKVEPMPQTVNATRPKLFEPVISGEYVWERLRKNYSHYHK